MRTGNEFNGVEDTLYIPLAVRIYVSEKFLLMTNSMMKRLYL